MSAIKFKEVSFSFENKLLFENLNIELPSNRWMGIIGPNGSGKTTFLKLMMGLLTPLKGEIVMSFPRKVGYVPQNFLRDQKYPISIRELILSGTLNSKNWWGRYSKEDYVCTQIEIERMGLQKVADASFSHVSGGQLQRALIGRALVSAPKLLLLDEPTANVDPETKERVFSLLEDLSKEMTILMVTHDLEDVVKYTHSVICMHHHTAHVKSPEDVKSSLEFGVYREPEICKGEEGR